MKHILAIDEGTTGTTCLVVSADGRVVGRGYREITQYYPQPGWVEHDPVEILDRTLEAAREAVAGAGIRPDAVGITNQRETIVVWERARPRAAPRAIVLARSPNSSGMCSARAQRGPGASDDRTDPRPVFLRRQTRVAAPATPVGRAGEAR